MSTPLPDDVRAALLAGRKIEAIRLLRGHTGFGLAQAKAAVEAGHLRDADRTTVEAGQLPAEVMAEMVAGNKIQAIRLLREATGLGLKEAKTLLDSSQGDTAQQALGPAPGEVPRRRLGSAVVLILVVLAIFWMVIDGA